MPLILKKIIKSTLLYNFFIILYSLGIHIASIFNNKAKLWVKGRVDFPKLDFSIKFVNSGLSGRKHKIVPRPEFRLARRRKTTNIDFDF
jgi:hypothetical protein